jgi:hypothetical protein
VWLEIDYVEAPTRLSKDGTLQGDYFNYPPCKRMLSGTEIRRQLASSCHTATRAFDNGALHRPDSFYPIRAIKAPIVTIDNLASASGHVIATTLPSSLHLFMAD